MSNTTKWFITNASLAFMEGANAQLDWSGWGFEPQKISQAVSNGFQQAEENTIVSIFPISHEEALRQRLGERADSSDEFGYYRIVSQEEAYTERDRLMAINAKKAERAANTPTEEDMYKAAQLRLLTEISNKLGGKENV